MQCLGLTEERHRCPQRASEGSPFCELHQEQNAEVPFARPAPSSRPTLSEWVDRLKGGPSAPPVPDPGKFDLPSWIKKSASGDLADHVQNNPNSITRWLSAFALRKRRDPQTIESLWNVLVHDSSRIVRQQTAVAIGKIGTPSALGPLLEGLWHDPDAGVREACAVALGNLGYPSAVGDLARVLERERDRFVRWDTILALGQLADETHEPLLISLSESEPAEFLRQAALEALNELRARRSASD